VLLPDFVGRCRSCISLCPGACIHVVFLFGMGVCFLSGGLRVLYLPPLSLA
jgi:hypothetical protein